MLSKPRTSPPRRSSRHQLQQSRYRLRPQRPTPPRLSPDAILVQVGHTLVVDVTTGKTVETIDGIGGADQVAYNPTLNYYYVAAYQYQVNGSATGAADPKVGIIDAATGTLLQTLKTDNITAHAVAVDPKTNKMMIPLAGKGIAIYDFVVGTSTTTATATTATATVMTTSAANRLGVCSVSLFSLLLLFSLALG